MKQLMNHLTECPVGSPGSGRGRITLLASVSLLLGASALGCSSEQPPTTTPPNNQGGSGGQVNPPGGTSGTGTTAGTGGTPGGGTGGSSSPTAGTAGTGGTPGGGTGGSSGGSGGASGGGGAGGGGGSGGGSDEGFVPLFNGTDLTGWTPSQGHAGLFGVSQVEGEGVIHVYPTQNDGSTQDQATLRTAKSYSNYVLQLEYKWGTDRFVPRANQERDNGICFHLCGDNVAKVWPESIEFQLGSQAWPNDWVAGHIFMLVTQTRAKWKYTMKDGQQVFAEDGTEKMIGGPTTSYDLARAPEQLNKNDTWNTIELTVRGSEEAQYKVNGTVVNKLYDMECQEGGTWAPLTEGPIALQAEFAEVYFRRVRIKEMQ